MIVVGINESIDEVGIVRNTRGAKTRACRPRCKQTNKAIERKKRKLTVREECRESRVGKVIGSKSRD